MAFTRYEKAGDIILESAVELGLTTAGVTDPFAAAATDANWNQLVTLMNHAGRGLMRMAWRQLIVTAQLVKSGGVWTLPTGWSIAAGTTDDLVLPGDFRALVEQSSWNQSTRLPLGGPLTPQLWEYRKSSPVGSIFAEFRMDTNRFRLLPTPLPDYTIQLEYFSRGWVIPSPGALGDGQTLGPAGADSVTAYADWVLFDPELASHALKLAWKR